MNIDTLAYICMPRGFLIWKLLLLKHQTNPSLVSFFTMETGIVRGGARPRTIQLFMVDPGVWQNRAPIFKRKDCSD